MDLFEGCKEGKDDPLLGPKHNNLGGIGPDGGVEELRFGGVGTFKGSSFDLVVTATSNVTRIAGEDTKHNVHHDDGYSGCNGHFGRIAIRSGSLVDLHFAFKTSTTNRQITLPKFHFTVLETESRPPRAAPRAFRATRAPCTPCAGRTTH